MEITEECLVMFYANTCEVQVLHYILMSSESHLGGSDTHTQTHTHFTLYLQWGWQQQADSPSRGSMLGRGVERRLPRCHAPEEYKQTHKSPTLLGLNNTKMKMARVWLATFTPKILQLDQSLRVHLLLHSKLLPTNATISTMMPTAIYSLHHPLGHTKSWHNRSWIPWFSC